MVKHSRATAGTAPFGAHHHRGFSIAAGKAVYILRGCVVVKDALFFVAHREGHRGGARPSVSEVRYAVVAVYSHRLHVAAASEEADEEKQKPVCRLRNYLMCRSSARCVPGSLLPSSCTIALRAFSGCSLATAVVV
ncbi:hypothetical protein MRX96_032911 [Rhipicephalus microplus]